MKKTKLLDGFDGSNKDAVRKIASKYEGELSRVAVFLPGIGCLDVISAFNSGLIDKTTKLILIEGAESVRKRAKIVRSQKKIIQKMGFEKVFWHPGRIETCPIDKFLDKGEVIDYVFFDVCNSTTDDYLTWLQFYRDKGCFAKDMRMCFTSVMCAINVKSTGEYASLSMEWNEQIKDFAEKVKCKVNLNQDDVQYEIDRYCGEYERGNGKQKGFLLVQLIKNIFFEFMGNRGKWLNFIEYKDVKKGNKGCKPILFIQVKCDLSKEKNKIQELAEVKEELESRKYRKFIERLKIPSVFDIQNNIVVTGTTKDPRKRKLSKEIITDDGKSVKMKCAGILAYARRRAKRMSSLPAEAEMRLALNKINSVRQQYSLPMITSFDKVTA